MNLSAMSVFNVLYCIVAGSEKKARRGGGFFEFVYAVGFAGTFFFIAEEGRKRQKGWGIIKTADVIVRILEVLDRELDKNNPDFASITYEAIGITKERWSFILEMMQDAGLIKGISFTTGGSNRAPIMTHIDYMNITLKGVMYLAENSTVNKVIKAAKLLKDTIPGL